MDELLTEWIWCDTCVNCRCRVANEAWLYHACQLRPCLVCFFVFDVFNYAKKENAFLLTNLSYNRLPVTFRRSAPEGYGFCAVLVRKWVRIVLTILAQKSKNGYGFYRNGYGFERPGLKKVTGKWHILVWNRVRVWRTEPYTPLKILRRTPPGRDAPKTRCKDKWVSNWAELMVALNDTNNSNEHIKVMY